MGRAGYSEDIDQWALIKWRGQVASATRGARGQRLLRDLLTALDAMPERELIRSELVTEQGAVCTLGALGRAQGLDMRDVDPDEPEQVTALFDAAHQLIREIMFQNDEVWSSETPADRWHRMRGWVADQIR